MRRFLATVIAVIGLSIAVFAGSLPKRAMFQGDHKTVTLEKNGSCWFDSRSTGRINGTYNIELPGNVVPGCSNITVTFNFGGQKMTGTIIWPVSDGIMLIFDGLTMTGIY